MCAHACTCIGGLFLCACCNAVCICVPVFVHMHADVSPFLHSTVSY